jgi:hypothetical protein
MFGRAITQPLGAPAGRIECFIEVPFMLREKQLFPDRLIPVTRGKTQWTALVEVKTHTNELGCEHIENYLDIAREQGFDSVLTISNEIPPADGTHPAWVKTRDAVSAGTCRATDKTLPDIAARFDALIQYAGLQLGRSLGEEVTPVMTRKERSDASVRSLALATGLAAGGTLTGGLNIPGSVAPLMVTADLRASKVSCHVDIDAPREGRPQTRVNWLLRQLKEAPDDLRVEAFLMHGGPEPPRLAAARAEAA